MSKVNSKWMPTQKVSEQNIGQSISLLRWPGFFPYCILLPSPLDLKETRFIRLDNLIPLLHGPVLMLTCPVCPDTFLSWPALSFSEVQATVALPCDQTRWASLRSPCASMRPWCQFTGCPSLKHFCYVLTTAYRDTPQDLVFWRCPNPVI